ncbi:MAG TPA: AbrB/MazE/SpoVT family DNA-binding domain-containing protein [Syntrophales bacterium]|nr:AbrB/MazE/SpoVT family DNA-binding domain-containing protein [Syntrophales bacterium]HOD98830.1 AbrB/MazE/SpoVT family DNA-binding domain-containing protein [Syntrophales bacterium]HOH73653.1 AbrB/MazE/SpoVT family DNA-binding domain-containing protein [Syntrophales bacterium]HPN08425.1 AbrB/MazE/SpoVT family DNA-binding domain-containing protein [Syntrophales bacterium]HPX82123.1 AbrB/MazE/SpoVT family DNA-binding domain-containing protein [Syntrophales bacterium]
MITARVTSKGQVTIPKEIRDKLGVHTGEDVGFEEKDGMLVISKVVTKSPFDKWVGKLKDLEGQRSDDLVREARGHDNSR